MRTKKITRQRIESEDFIVARKRAGLTVVAAAQMLHVTKRTIQNWENNTSQIPYSAFRLMRLYGGHSIVNKAWEGWSMWQGVLYSPAGRAFEPYQLVYLGNYLWMARQWLKERQTAKTLKPSIGEPAVRDEASGATAPSGSRLHQGHFFRGSNVASLQEKTTRPEGPEKYSQFGSIGEAANDVIESEVQ